MSDVSIFKIDNQSINVKDSTARQSAASAKNLATTASANASTALTKVTKLEELSRLEVGYESATETLLITTGTHNIA